MSGILSSVRGADCCFCEDFAHQDRPLLMSREGFVNKVCKETEFFAAWPSLSPVAPAHTLVVPKYHVTSVSQIESRHIGEFMVFLGSVTALLERSFGNVYLFEHGIGTGRTGGCGVRHAHLHLVSLSSDAARHVGGAIRAAYPVKSVRGLPGLCEDEYRGDSYIMFGPSHGPFVVAPGASVPSQYLRRLVAQAQGLAEWDWREYFGWNRFTDTFRLLSGRGVETPVELPGSPA